MADLLFDLEYMINDRLLGVPRRWLADNLQVWLPVAVIAGVLFLSLALPMVVSSPRQMILLIGLLPAVGALLVLMRWPSFGPVALIVTGLIVPSPPLPGGLNLVVVFLGLLVGLWLLTMIFDRNEARLVPSRTIRPVLALVLTAAIAFGVGQLPWFSFGTMAPLDAQLGGLGIFALCAGAFLLVAHQVRDLRWLEWMTWLFVALAALFVAGWVVPGLGGITSRLFQLGATSSSMFWTWLVALAFSQAYLNQDLPLPWRVTLGGIVLVTMYVALGPSGDWKSGWVPPLVAIAAIIGLRSWRSGLAIGLLALTKVGSLFSQVISSDEYSYSTRLDAWKIILEMIKINPVTGFGPANYYFYTRLYHIRGYDVVFNSHNQYLDIIAQTGLLGLGCVLWFAWEVGMVGWRLCNRLSGGFARAYAYGAVGGLVATLVSGMLVDWFIPFVYNIGFNGFRGSMLPWLFLGGLVSLEQITRQQTVPQAQAAKAV